MEQPRAGGTLGRASARAWNEEARRWRSTVEPTLEAGSPGANRFPSNPHEISSSFEFRMAERRAAVEVGKTFGNSVGGPTPSPSSNVGDENVGVAPGFARERRTWPKIRRGSPAHEPKAHFLRDPYLTHDPSMSASRKITTRPTSRRLSSRVLRANSILARALGARSIDRARHAVRIVAGAVDLVALPHLSGSAAARERQSEFRRVAPCSPTRAACLPRVLRLQAGVGALGPLRVRPDDDYRGREHGRANVPRSPNGSARRPLSRGLRAPHAPRRACSRSGSSS